MANIQGGSSTSNVANVDTDFQLAVKTNTDPTKAGAARLFSEVDPGTVVAGGLLLSPEASEDYRLRVGVDTMLDQEVFCYANQNTGKHFYNATTLTMALSGGSLVTNGSSITTINTGAVLKTWRPFSVLLQQTPLFVEFSLALSAAMATNTTIDIGLFIPGASTFAPSDGVYIRINSSGVFGVLNNNGTENVSSAFSGLTLATNQVNQFVISIQNTVVQFWVNDVLYARMTIGSSLATATMSSSLPFAINHRIGGTAAGSVVQAKLFAYSVFGGDVDRDKPWGETMVAGGGSPQVQQGATTGGQLTTYALGAAPGAVTLTASTAPATNTLGGLFLLPAAITAGESDYPIFAWQNPAGTTTVPGKVFYCRGMIIGDSFVTTALTGGPIMLAWAVGYGSTAASLATTETTTFAANTTKIARKLPLGITQAFAATAAVGVVSAGRQVIFDTPLPVNPGEFLHAIMRAIGTSTSAGAIRGSVTFLGYFE